MPIFMGIHRKFIAVCKLIQYRKEGGNAPSFLY